MGGDPVWWDRNTSYNLEPILTADVVVMITPNNNWGMTITDLTRGCAKEWKLAVGNNMPRFIAYRTKEGYKFYLNDKNRTDLVIGVAGTSLVLPGLIKRGEEKISNYKDSLSIVLDRRLLLLS